LLWIPAIAAAIFFLITDLLQLTKRKQMNPDDGSTADEKADVDDGVLGSYVVDSTKVRGLFIELHAHRLFVDIKQDELQEARSKRAQLLFRERSTLEASLGKFLERNPSFASRRITYIGLHASDLTQGEVFWEPSGYTLLKGLEFVDPDVS